MSHTNSTTNYNLPQFVGTDKPTWLNDVNGAMSAIDTQMKANADSATQANTNATTAINATGSLANLETTDKTSLVNAINEVNTNTNTVSGVASGAVTTANEAKTKVDSVESYLDITTFTTATVSGSNVTLTLTNIACASNANGTLGKIYGNINLTTNINGTCTVTFDSPLRPTSPITINGGVVSFWADGSGNFTPMNVSYTIAIDGTVSFSINGSTGRSYRLYFINSLIFAQNFGDVPSPE